MKEFTGTLNLTIEVTVKAKSKDEALLFFDDLYANITIENDGKREIEIVDDNLSLIEFNWELDD
ncbi:hypothetical protein [Microcystis wesenbergii]|uniref:Uncharacterized protein n=1 Tax=Microcystis wesenbergii NRERC-220 TaxID=3068991 RepID=A0ABU3HU35_9CHRO|nr:hypothetical protein [Microcystis wesenbergii]MDT3677195.1 hypothetical protein [Microcystis wesenbergii NRERC-220]